VGRSRRRPELEVLESRLTPAATSLVLVPRPVVEVNPQPLPPGAVIEFDAQPLFAHVVPPGPTQVTDTTFHVEGALHESGQVEQPPGPGRWSLDAEYNLTVRVHETIVPPGPPIAPTGVGGSPGSVILTYAVTGVVNSILTVTPGGDNSQTVLHSDQENLTTTGSIAGTLSFPDPSKGQQMDLTGQALTNITNTGTVHKLPGRPRFGTITLERGVVRDQSLYNWQQNLQSNGAVSTIELFAFLTDQLEQRVQLIPGDAPPSTFTIAAEVHGTGSLAETLVPPGPSGLLLTGAIQSEGRLDETVTTATPGGASQTSSEQVEAQGDFWELVLGT
jgi:hypothetical protein